MTFIKPIAAVFIVVLLGAAAPSSADHAMECRDEYVCTSGGRVLSVSGTLTVEGGTVTVTAEHHQGQRFSSEGHTETDSVTATVTLRLDEQPATTCSPDASSITFAGSDATSDVRVSSSAEGCSFDLVWTSVGNPGVPTVSRRTELAPNVPPAFFAAAAGDITVSQGASVAGTVQGLEASGSGAKRDHWYAGHVTLSE